MWKILIRINKNLVSAIPVMMIAGFLFGAAVDAELVFTLKGLIVPLTFLMVYPMMVSLNIKPKSCIHKVQKNALSLQNNMLHS